MEWSAVQCNSSSVWSGVEWSAQCSVECSARSAVLSAVEGVQSSILEWSAVQCGVEWRECSAVQCIAVPSAVWSGLEWSAQCSATAVQFGVQCSVQWRECRAV